LSALVVNSVGNGSVFEPKHRNLRELEKRSHKVYEILIKEDVIHFWSFIFTLRRRIW